jgi:DNA polymerase-2
MRGFVLTPTYRLVDGVPEVHLHGVLESGEPCLIIDDRARPHFFVRTADRAAVERVARGVRLDDCRLRTFTGEPVLRVTVAVPGDVPPLRGRLEAAGVPCLEADVRFAYRFLIDHDIRGAFTVEGTAERGDGARIYRNPTLRPCAWTPRLKILSLDIETSLTGDRLYSIALHSPEVARVLLVYDRPVEHAEVVHSERSLVRRFLEYVRALDPDVLTGWNVIDFDLAVLARAAQRHGLRFAIGRTDDVFDRRRDSTFTRESRAVVYGRVVLDALSLMRGAFIRLQDYKLETAARAFLGRGKLIAGEDRGAHLERLYRDDPAALVAYNLEDARLVSDLLERTGLIDLAVERSCLTGMPLDRVSAAIASVDSLYLRALRARGVVAPSVHADTAAAQITGGYVMDSVPGLYANVLVFDFKSLYPSIIRTFNLDPLTWLPDGAVDGEPLMAPNGARFRRTPPGVLPALVAALATARAEAQRAGRPIKANAIKILMNSLYGVLGSPASRLFFPAVANAITHFGQLLIRAAADAATAAGHRVIYGDTDSLFVDLGEPDPAAALALAETLRAEIGAAVAGVVQTRFGCESRLELEFEKLYRRFFLPEVRGGRVGSKKRYAGLVVSPDGIETIEFVGLESVRRDWSELSKRFQAGLLDLVFHDRPVDGFVRGFVADLHAGRFDDQLAYRKAVRKDLDAYTKTTPPHVQAARRQQRPAGRIVEYVITHHGPEPVGETTAPPDYAHYVTHQLKPVADAILRFLGTDFDRVADTRRQLTLF